jgi:hypothetical protein
METIFSKAQPQLLLHIIHRASDIDQQRKDVVPANQFLQMAAMKLPAGKTFRPHKHLFRFLEKALLAGDMSVSNYITQESWVVIKGRVKCILYDITDEIIAEPILEQGDCSITLRGGHNYEILEDDTLVYEYKTGPYEGQEKDKTFI